MKYEIYSQLPKPKKIGVCSFALGTDGTIVAFNDDSWVATLIRGKVDWAHADGIMVSGVEAKFYRGIERLRIQQWFLRYIHQ